MNQIDKCLEDLLAAIKNSGEYKYYLEMKEQLKSNPETEKAVHEYRRRNYNLQNNKEHLDLFAEIDRFDEEFSEFRKKPFVEDYLAAELAFCRLIQYVNWEIMDKLDFDLGSFNI
jgi:cell fate (sporulation/competence/biofilm development) regulator YlbF (YheA/YmcA/DUF963 family)